MVFASFSRSYSASYRFNAGRPTINELVAISDVKNEMELPRQPRLAFLHSENALNSVKLAHFRRLSTEVIRLSLLPGQSGSLKVRPDGTVLDGHHRLSILLERDEDLDRLPREIMEKE